MTGNVKTPLIPPRVFISYARTDGEGYARELRLRLQAEGIPLWQDRIGMEGGRNWWLQITEALDQVEFMVLVMTPAAMQSPMIRKEWRHARQQGVCVYPVKAAPDLNFASLPHWMSRLHFYDLVQEWPKFLNDLNTRCEKVCVPFMVEDLPPDFVPRPQEFSQLIGKLLDQERGEPIAITAAVRGAGGYGKTTLAQALCHDERIQQAFDDGILWVTLGENPGNLVSKIEDLISTLSHERPSFSGLDAATARLAELLTERTLLLVIDDVWNAAHLKPFLQGGKHCARLITTRNEDVLPSDAQSITVDAMRSDEAMQLLSADLDGAALSGANHQTLSVLAACLGEWALLLKLANGRLRKQVSRGQSLSDALVYLNIALDKHGLVAFDAENVQERHQAVEATLRVSLELLNGEDYTRYQELAVFPEDVAIPLATLHQLWAATGGLDAFNTEELCVRLYELSLLLQYDPAKHIIRLHDVVRTYLQHKVGTELLTLHAHLLDAYRCKHWADLSPDEPYLWDHLAEHLLGAGRSRELITTVKDLRYLATKTLARNAYTVEVDLTVAEQQIPDDSPLRLLKRNFINMEHLLNRCETFNAVASTLHSRLQHFDELSELCRAFERKLSRPYLTSWHPLPDLPHPALIRTLEGGSSSSCAVSPDGEWIVSVSDYYTLKVWDVRTGQVRLTLRGHTNTVTKCAVSPDGEWIVSASSDHTLKVWDARTGQVRLTLQGHTLGVNDCAVSPDGEWIVSASYDNTFKVWDVRTGQVRLTLQGFTGSNINSCAVSPDGEWIVSASYGHAIKVWDVRTGQVRLTLQRDISYACCCAVSPDGEWIVSASGDGTPKVWDARTGQVRLTLQGPPHGVNGFAVSPDGSWIVSASSDHTLEVWDARTGQVRLTLQGHTNSVTSCAVSPDGKWIVSASWDQTLKVWDAHPGQVRLAVQGHSLGVNDCAVSPKGNWVVSASDDHTLKVWDAHTGQVRLTLQGHTNPVTSCAVSPNGEWIVSTAGSLWDGEDKDWFGEDQTLKVWDARTGQVRLTLRGHSNMMNSCAISPKGDWIVSASSDLRLKVWDAASGAERLSLWGHTSLVNDCAVSPDGTFIVSASSDETLKVWDARTGQERLTLYGHRDAVYACAVSPQGDWIVSASGDKTLKVWDVRTGQVRLTLQDQGEATPLSCAVSPQGNWIASTMNNGTLKMWDVRTGSCLTTLYVDGPLLACAFYPDGEHIVACGASGMYFLRLVQ